MMVDLKGKTALVTGSTSGIGKAVAWRLAEAGAHIMLSGLGEPDAIAALVHDTEQRFGVRVAHSPADMRDPQQIAAMIALTERSFGTLDILVNNAGIQHTALVEDFPATMWDAVIAINLSAAFHTIRTALPGMKQRGFGRIINIASAHGLVASPMKSAYVAAKHGLVGLTKTVALETAQSAITCNAICPGWVHTPLVQKQIEDKAAQQGVSVEEATRRLLAEKEPSQRFTTPEQIGGLALFLCGPDGANMTGAALSHDGGWTAQ